MNKNTRLKELHIENIVNIITMEEARKEQSTRARYTVCCMVAKIRLHKATKPQGRFMQ